MAKLIINNIGPLKTIDIILNRINVFIGPQSIGKSTLAKLISFCNWLEKDCVLHQDINHVDYQFIENNLINYHNLAGYFDETSYFGYEGNAITFKFEKGNVYIQKTASFSKIELSKNAYIPSERNILAVPGIFSIKMPDNYLLEFIDDWQEIRTKYTQEDEIDILNLGSHYFYNDRESSDMLHLDNGKNIKYSQASSGLQSITPLCVCIDYLTNWIYLHEESRSAEERKQYRERLSDKYWLNIYDSLGTDGINAIKELSEGNQEEIRTRFKNILNKIKNGEMNEMDIPKEYGYLIISFSQFYKLSYNLTHPSSTNLVIEEPEQNLFPETQVQLIYYIFSKIDHANNRDSLVITTHSPYILYALNNCLLSSIASNEDENMVSEISSVPKEAWINPDKVSVWELRDGSITDGKTIQDSRGLIRGNYFERVMHNVISDFTNLLNVL